VVASRLPLTEALDFAAEVLEITAFRAQAVAAADGLRRGENLAQAMAGLSFLHPVSRQLLEAGEASARLAPMSDRAAVLAETWMRSERKRLTAVLEPAAMVFVGLAVLVIVLAVLLPVFDMQAMVSI
jgi:general secretion pathway protein F